ncbi:hypothetical protein [Faecalibaculum rodentium]|uniref:hypothetical protein n=1 Tax=Faecalibaculum rodentium TaxID=1702221 RepID=UPI003F674F3D
MKFHMPMIAGVDNAAAEKNVQPWVWPYGLKGRQTAVAVSSLHLFKQGRLPKPVLLPQPAVGLVCLLELVLLPDRAWMTVAESVPEHTGTDRFLCNSLVIWLLTIILCKVGLSAILLT